MLQRAGCKVISDSVWECYEGVSDGAMKAKEEDREKDDLETGEGNATSAVAGRQHVINSTWLQATRMKVGSVWLAINRRRFPSPRTKPRRRDNAETFFYLSLSLLLRQQLTMASDSLRSQMFCFTENEKNMSQNDCLSAERLSKRRGACVFRITAICWHSQLASYKLMEFLFSKFAGAATVSIWERVIV